MKNAISYTEFARQRGISQPMVSRYIRTGAISRRSLIRVGKRWKIIPDLATQDLENNLDPNFRKDSSSPKAAPRQSIDDRVIVDGVDFSDVAFPPTPENTGFMFIMALRIQLYISACLHEPYRSRLIYAINEVAKILGSGIDDLEGEELDQRIKDVPRYPTPTGGLQDYIILGEVQEYTADQDKNVIKNTSDFDELL